MRLFIASADGTFRLALLLLTESEPGLVVTGMSDRSEGLPAIVRASQPDVLLLDYELIRGATTDLIGDSHSLEPRLKIIVFSVNPRAKEAMLAAGADDFISKNVPPDELLPILRRMRSSASAYQKGARYENE